MVTNKGDAWMIAASPVSLPGLGRPVIDSVVQEIDIKTGLVLFEWHSLDHVALSESYKYTASQPGHIVDPYHLNSISLDRAGNVIVSMRNTSAIYKLDRRTGRIIWRLGGMRSSFKMGPGTTTGFQHSVTVHPDGTLTIFDNGAGPPKVHPVLPRDPDLAQHAQDDRDAGPDLRPLADDLGELRGRRAEAGRRPGVPRLRRSGRTSPSSTQRAGGLRREVRDRQLELPGLSLQVERQAPSPPAVAAARSGAAVTVWASWNGATGVARWRMLAGPRPGSLRPVTVVRKRGFETAATIPARRYVAVQALGAKGRVLGRSRTVPAG